MKTIALLEFEELARKYFAFLEAEYGYTYQGAENIPFMYFVKYLKDYLLIRIGLAYRHNYIEIFIFNKIHTHLPTSQDLKHAVSLPHLIYAKNKEDKKHLMNDSEYENLMPSKISYDDSLKELSQLLKKYGDDVLTGKKWVRGDS